MVRFWRELFSWLADGHVLAVRARGTALVHVHGERALALWCLSL